MVVPLVLVYGPSVLGIGPSRSVHREPILLELNSLKFPTYLVPPQQESLGHLNHHRPLSSPDSVFRGKTPQDDRPAQNQDDPNRRPPPTWSPS